MKSIASKSRTKLGIVPTHVQFVGGLVPDDQGNMPRDEAGEIIVVSRTRKLMEIAAVQLDCIQISLFPGVAEADLNEMVEGLKALGLEVHFILMVGGAGDPMNPEDENKIIDTMIPCLEAANRFNIETVSSTSVEQWMQPGSVRKEGADFEAAIDQNVSLHLKACEQAKISEMSIKSWHIEFLRDVEFQTFTDVSRCWQFVKRANEAAGQPFFKVLVDAAHCGDSRLSIDENLAMIDEIAAADGLTMFHASAKTTRGCLTTDDGWIGALMAACVKTGKLEYVFGEMFHHEDVALQTLRDEVEGHGIDTTDGRTYDTMLAEGINDLGRRLNNLAARGYGHLRG